MARRPLEFLNVCKSTPDLGDYVPKSPAATCWIWKPDSYLSYLSLNVHPLVICPEDLADDLAARDGQRFGQKIVRIMTVIGYFRSSQSDCLA